VGSRYRDLRYRTREDAMRGLTAICHYEQPTCTSSSLSQHHDTPVNERRTMIRRHELGSSSYSIRTSMGSSRSHNSDRLSQPWRDANFRRRQPPGVSVSHLGLLRLQINVQSYQALGTRYSRLLPHGHWPALSHGTGDLRFRWQRLLHTQHGRHLAYRVAGFHDRS